jgi:hypothetical protein
MAASSNDAAPKLLLLLDSCSNFIVVTGDPCTSSVDKRFLNRRKREKGDFLSGQLW